MIGRYGGCFEEGIWWVYDTGERCTVLERLAMVEGRKVRMIHGLNLSHKELIYLLQKPTSYQSKVLRTCSQGDRLVGKDHRLSPTATHKEDNQKINHATTSSHNGSRYVHATRITNFNTSISQIHNYSASMALISPSPYLKTIIKYQTSHGIQCTLYESFYYIPLGCPSYQD